MKWIIGTCLDMDTLDYFAEMVRRTAKNQGSFTVEGPEEGPATVKLVKNDGYTYYYCTLTHKTKGFNFDFGVMLENNAPTPKQELYCSPEKGEYINSGLINNSSFFKWKTEKETGDKWLAVKEPHNSDFFSDATNDKVKEALLVNLFTELNKLLV